MVGKKTIVFSSLHREALKQSAIDPTTGCVDINILAAGMSTTSRNQIEKLAKVIRDELRPRKGITVSAKKLAIELRKSDKFVCFCLTFIGGYFGNFANIFLIVVVDFEVQSNLMKCWLTQALLFFLSPFYLWCFTKANSALSIVALLV